MAESQVPFAYLPERLRAIRASISEPRFATYMAKGGNHEEYAFALYLYNARLAKAFLYPLNIVEVTLRNAIDQMLIRRFGDDWPENPSFRQGILSPDGLSALDKGIQRAGAGARRDQVVATLTFDFWSNLFRPEYGDLWRTTINVVFPNLPRGQSRGDIQKLVKSINAFRNRVAHHEPILDLNVTDVFAKIARLTELRCSETARWMKHYATLNSVIRTRPRHAGTIGETLSSRLDVEFLRVDRTTTLLEIFGVLDEKHPVVVCANADGVVEAAFTLADLALHVAERSLPLGGLIALGDHSVGEMLETGALTGRWVALEDSTLFGLAVKELQKPKVRVLVGLDVDGRATGVIARAHRRY